MNYILEHYKRFSKMPEISFNDSVSVALNLEPTKALEYLKKKALKSKVSVKWDEWNKEAHNKSFTVAGVLNADLLQEIANYVNKSIKNGTSFEDFKKDAVNGGLMERMQKAGWSGKTPNRLKVIYDTNLKVAAAQGKYEQLFLTKDVFPNAKYIQVERTTKRHDHSLLHNQVFSLNDPILNTIAPPSAFHCGCRLIPTKEATTKPNLDFIGESKDFQISPLEVWKPKINKYTTEIADQLKSYFKKVGDVAQKVVEKVENFTTNVVLKLIDISESLIDKITNYKDNIFPSFDISKSHAFKMARQYYIGTKYLQINKDLRNNKDNSDYNDLKKEGFTHKLEPNSVLFRGISATKGEINTILQSYQSGKFSQLTSFSLNPRTAGSFAGFADADNSVFIRVKLVNDVNTMLGSTGETEFIFDKNTNYKLTNTTKYKKDGRESFVYVLDVEI